MVIGFKIKDIQFSTTLHSYQRLVLAKLVQIYKKLAKFHNKWKLGVNKY